MQVESERHSLARIKAKFNTKKLQVGAYLITAGTCFDTPGAGRLVRDQVALSATAGEPCRCVNVVAAKQSGLNGSRGLIWAGEPKNPIIHKDARFHTRFGHVLGPEKAHCQAEEGGQRTALQQAVVGAMPPVGRVRVHNKKPQLPTVNGFNQRSQCRRGPAGVQSQFQDGHRQGSKNALMSCWRYDRTPDFQAHNKRRCMSMGERPGAQPVARWSHHWQIQPLRRREMTLAPARQTRKDNERPLPKAGDLSSAPGPIRPKARPTKR